MSVPDPARPRGPHTSLTPPASPGQVDPSSRDVGGEDGGPPVDDGGPLLPGLTPAVPETSAPKFFVRGDEGEPGSDQVPLRPSVVHGPMTVKTVQYEPSVLVFRSQDGRLEVARLPSGMLGFYLVGRRNAKLDLADVVKLSGVLNVHRAAEEAVQADGTAMVQAAINEGESTGAAARRFAGELERLLAGLGERGFAPTLGTTVVDAALAAIDRLRSEPRGYMVASPDLVLQALNARKARDRERALAVAYLDWRDATASAATKLADVVEGQGKTAGPGDLRDAAAEVRRVLALDAEKEFGQDVPPVENAQEVPEGVLELLRQTLEERNRADGLLMRLADFVVQHRTAEDQSGVNCVETAMRIMSRQREELTRLRDELAGRRADEADDDQVTRLADFLLDHFPGEVNGRLAADIAIELIRKLVSGLSNESDTFDPLAGLRRQADKFREQRDRAEKTIGELRADVDQFRGDHQRACETIARMHEAGTGRVGVGPVRGVVEDLADEHQRRLAAEKALRVANQKVDRLSWEMTVANAALRQRGKPGDRVEDGGVMGTLVRCPQCGDGLLHLPDELPETAAPQPEPAAAVPDVDEGLPRTIVRHDVLEPPVRLPGGTVLTAIESKMTIGPTEIVEEHRWYTDRHPWFLNPARSGPVRQFFAPPTPAAPAPMTMTMTGPVDGPVTVWDVQTGEALAVVPNDGTQVTVRAVPGRNVTFLGGLFSGQMRRVPLMRGDLPAGLVCVDSPDGNYELVYLPDEESSPTPVYVGTEYAKWNPVALADVPDPVTASRAAREWDAEHPGLGIHPRWSPAAQETSGRLEFTLHPNG